MREADPPAPIRVGFVIAGLYGGGAERSMLSIMETLDRRRFAPTLILFDDVLNHAPPQDVPRIVLAGGNPLRIGRMVSRIFELSRVVRRERLDLLVSFLIGPNIVTILAARRAGVPAAIGERSAPRAVLSRRHLGWQMLVFWSSLVRLLYPRASLIIANTEGARRELIASLRVPAARVAVLGNPLDLDRIAALAAEPLDTGSWPAGPVLVHVGRFSYAKDHATLLQAFARVRRGRVATLVLVGDGEDEAQVRALTTSLGLDRDVVFTGFTRNPYNILKRATLSVLTSRFEGLPNAIIEAMALGIPVVSTACEYGPIEVIGDNEFGVLTPVGDAEAFAAAVEALLDDPARQRELAARGLTRAREFDRRAIAHKYEEVLTTVLQRSARTS